MNAGLLNAILQLALAAIGTIATLAVASFTKFGDRLINHKFDKRIELYKSGLEREIEKLKATLSHVTDRGARSNQLEYEAITAAWERYIDAHIATQQCVVNFLEHPDFNKMEPGQLDEYLKLTELSDAQKKQVREAENRNGMYAKVNRDVAKHCGPD